VITQIYVAEHQKFIRGQIYCKRAHILCKEILTR